MKRIKKEYIYKRYHNIVLDEYKTFYVIIPKVASTSIKRYLCSLLDISIKDNVHDMHYPYFIHYKFSDYFSFTFIRNPWDRLVSCYNNKIFDGVDSPTSQWLKRIGLYKENLKFDEFVNIVCGFTDEETEFHCRSQWWYINNGGTIFVDFIGKLENFSQDWKKICDISGMPYESLGIGNKTSCKNYWEYYDEELVDMVGKRYNKDVIIGDYKFFN